VATGYPAAVAVGSAHLVAVEGGYRITPYDPDLERQMEVARRVMKLRAFAAVEEWMVLRNPKGIGRRQLGYGRRRAAARL
jgi:hypothetical protein